MLDPATRDLLEGALRPSGANQTAEGVRATNSRISALLAGPLEAVATIAELTVISADRTPVPVRIYRPASPLPMPVIVYCHGGGWVAGDPDSYDAFIRALANACGAVIIFVDYRLAPENIYPAALDDSLAVLEWTFAHAKDIGGDATRIAIAGDSAGGNLAAVAASMFRDQPDQPVAQLLLYPVLDATMSSQSYDELATGYFLTRAGMTWFWDNYLGGRSLDRRDPRISPLFTRDLVGLPPALVLACGYDPLRDEGFAYVNRLRTAGVPVNHLDYPNAIHGFLRFRAPLETARLAALAVGRFARQVFDPNQADTMTDNGSPGACHRRAIEGS